MFPYNGALVESVRFSHQMVMLWFPHINYSVSHVLRTSSTNHWK